MGIVIGAVIGLTLAAFGFAGMRNPMRLNLAPLSPSVRGYYQRMVLDTFTRNQLRVLGTVICLFGSSIFTECIGRALRSHGLVAVSGGLWMLMGCIFLGAWTLGLVLFIWQSFRGQTFDWLQAWRLAAQLGPIDVFPAVTPKMRKEARVFTIVFLILAGIAALASLFAGR